MTESSTEASSQDPSGVGSEPLRSSHRGVMWHIEPGLPPKNPDSRRKRKKLTKDQQVGFPGGASGKEPTCQCRRYKRLGFDPWVGKIPWRRTWQPTPVFFPAESPWTEEPSRLQSIGSPSWTWVKQLSTHTSERGEGTKAVRICSQWYELEEPEFRILAPEALEFPTLLPLFRPQAAFSAPLPFSFLPLGPQSSFLGLPLSTHSSCTAFSLFYHFPFTNGPQLPVLSCPAGDGLPQLGLCYGTLPMWEQLAMTTGSRLLPFPTRETVQHAERPSFWL